MRLFVFAGKSARFAIAASGVILLGACSAVLGLTDPERDDSIGNDDGGSPFDDTGIVGDDGSTGGCDPLTIDSDPANCGACGHDCLGGDCVNSACQPVLVVDDQTNLAPRYMIEDQTNLYVTNARSTDGELSSAAVVSKSAIEGVPAADVLGVFDDGDGGNFRIIYPFQIAQHGTDLYVALTASLYEGNFYQGGLAKCTAGSCDAPDSLFISQMDSYAVAADGSQLYYGYADLQDGGLGSEHFEVRAILFASGADTVLYEVGSSVNFLLADGAHHVLIGTNTGLIQGDDTSGPTTTLVTGTEIDQMSIFNNKIYYTSAPGNGVLPVVGSVPIGSTTVTPIASGDFLQAPAGIAVDTRYVYVADLGDLNVRSSGQVFRCPLATGCGDNGANAEVLSTGDSAGNNPRTIVAADKDAIYWGNRYGQIWKLAK